MAFVEADGRNFSGSLLFRAEADVCAGHASLACGWRCENGVLEAYAYRVGFFPLFYWAEGPRLIVSDSIGDLAARLPQAKFDDEAVAAYLLLGYYIADTTLLRGVSVLSPNATLRWDGHLTVRGGIDFARTRFAGSRNEAIEEYDRLFSKAVARRVTPDVGRITLSGGRDSRHILLELHRQRALPRAAVTLKRRNSNDHQIAGQLAQRVGIDCMMLDDDLDPFAVETAKNRLNCFMADENGWYVPILTHLEGSVFDGLGGDVLSNGLYFSSEVADLVESGTFANAADSFVGQHGGYLSYLSRKARMRFSETLARNLIANEFERHSRAPNPVQSFVFWNRTRREIAFLPIGMARTKVDPLLPYTDVDVLDFLLSLPYREFGAQGFHDDLIRKVYPSFSDIGYASKLKPVYTLRERFSYATKASARLLGPLAANTRVLVYAAAAVSGPTIRAIDIPFSRLFPLLQAQQELGIEV